MPTRSWRPKPSVIPDEPGVYRFRDGLGTVIYVGKAKSLRSRLTSYFGTGLHPRTAAMVDTAVGLDWVVVDTEVEALQLEYSWIKEYDPRFNVKYRDDKSYPYLAVTVGKPVPRVMVVRGAKRKGTRYFGPYAHAWAIRETVDQLLRVFPMRSCSDGVFRRAAAANRPCLLADIGKCSAPCVGRVSQAEHRAIVEDFCSFVGGRPDAYIAERTKEMKEAAAQLDFETAARLRDDIGALNRALERSAVVLPDRTDADVVSIADDDLQASVQVFSVRGGRISGQRGFVLEKAEALEGPALLGTALSLHYGGVDDSSGAVPREVLVPQMPEPHEALQAWLSQLRGGPVVFKVPQRGDKKALLDTVTRNAEQSLTLHKARRSTDLTARSAALNELAEALDLPEPPLRIECFDVSHLAGSDPVASMVVFEDGLPKRAHYRTFNIKSEQATDDTRAMAEVLRRRFARLEPAANSGIEAVGEHDQSEGSRKPSGFSYPPALIVVDGGAPQVAAARVALDEVLVNLPVIGLAKRLEEVWLPDQADPVILSRTSHGLYLLQQLRDEAHRSAIRAQRRKRATRVRGSLLDGISGLGPARRKALLRSFGSMRAIRAASAEQIAEVPASDRLWLPRSRQHCMTDSRNQWST